jgi:hypothetical protein
MKKLTLLFCYATLSLCMMTAGFGANKENFLLTENGVNNPTYSEYKKAPMLKTGGTYYAVPAFDSGFAKNHNEKGTVTTPTPFTEGILCNGDTSYDYKRKTPFPYVYWPKHQSYASLFFDLKKEYFISKVRVKILLAPKIHGISKISIYTWDEMFEASSQPLKEINQPIRGWNEFIIGKPSDKIKLDFTAAPGCPYMTVTEVEIWGKESSPQAGATRKAESISKRLLSAAEAAEKRGYFAFDFGMENSPVWKDFTPVNEKIVYTKERGYGWIPFKGGTSYREKGWPGAGIVPGLFSQDRGIRIEVCDDFHRDICASQKVYHSQLDQEFAVDIKNGKYLVYLCSGDIMYGKPGIRKMTVDAEGKQVVKGISCDFSLCGHAQFETEVRDGQLNLRFGCYAENDYEQHWSANGVLVFPCNNDKEKAVAQKTISEFEKEISVARDAAFAKAFKEVKYEETTKLFPLSKQDTDRGYILFVREWMKMIYPNTVPQKTEADKAELSIWCSPGEYEPATFGIYPLAKNLEGQITVSDLVSPSKDKIAKNNISIRVTGYLPERMKKVEIPAGDYIYYRSDGGQRATYMAKVPKILWPYKDKINIDETKQIWLTVHVPKTAKPGKYEGTVAFKPVGKPQQSLKLNVEVYPIALQKSDRVQGMYWMQEGLYFDSETRRKELLDMAEHGIRSISHRGVIPDLLNAKNGNLTLDFTQQDALIQDLKAAGLTKYMPFRTSELVNRLKYLCRTDAINMSFDDAYAYAIGEIYKHAQKNGWPEVLFYPVDEIGNGVARMNELKHLVPLIRRTPGTKIYCTANNYASGVECADYIDYWCANIQMPKEQMQDVLNRGKVFMRYGNANNYNPRISRTVSGFGFWRIPASAMYYWHYQYVKGDPFNTLDTERRDYIASYPTPEGPVNSIDIEAIREGIDDLNYIYTLQQLMDKAKKAGKGGLAKAGEAVLDEITTCIPSYNQYDFEGIPNEKYHEWRLRMAQEIMKIQAALK